MDNYDDGIIGSPRRSLFRNKTMIVFVFLVCILAFRSARLDQILGKENWKTLEELLVTQQQTPLQAQQQQQTRKQQHALSSSPMIPLSELACLYTENATSSSFHLGDKIPKLLHQAIPSSHKECPKRVNNIPSGFTLAIHTESSRNMLLQQDWPNEFPHLRPILQCVQHSRHALLDVWKYLVLWEYGGMMLEYPTFPGETPSEQPKIQIWPRLDLVLEQIQIQSERSNSPFHSIVTLHPRNRFDILESYFASTPRHLFLYYTLHHALMSIQRQQTLYFREKQHVQGRRFHGPDLGGLWTTVTGRGALTEGLAFFLSNQSQSRYAPEGGFVGGVHTPTWNSSILLVSTKQEDANGAVIWKKQGEPPQHLYSWHANFFPDYDEPDPNRTCLSILYDYAIKGKDMTFVPGRMDKRIISNITKAEKHEEYENDLEYRYAKKKERQRERQQNRENVKRKQELKRQRAAARAAQRNATETAKP